MSDEQQDKPKTNKPLETFRDRALSVSVFRNEGEKGDFFSVVPRKIYTTDQGEIRESKSLTGSEPLRQANLLGEAYSHVEQLKAEMRAEKSRDTDRER